MEVENDSFSIEEEIKALQDCNTAISAINTNLQKTLSNLDHLSESISRFYYTLNLLFCRSNTMMEQWMIMWKRLQENQ